jgi:polyphosphate kinase
VLTPLAVDPAHPFPYISGLSLNLAVTVRDPEGRTERFARVKVPNNVPRLVRVAPDPGSRREGTVVFLPVEDLIAAHLGDLFTGMEVAEVHAFRVTRNADVEVEEDRDEDLLQSLERELARRRFGPPVRLEVTDTMSEHVLELLLRELDVDPHDVVTVPGLLDLTALWAVHAVDRPDLKDDPFVPATHPAFAERETPRSIFATLREGDVLVHHPYDSFSTSCSASSSRPPPTRTCWRSSRRSTARRATPRSSTRWSTRRGRQAGRRAGGDQGALRRAGQHPLGARAGEGGVHVVYGWSGLKTHCKTSLVCARRATIRRYCHIGTATTTPRPPGSTRTWACSPPTRPSAPTSPTCSTRCTGYSRQTSYRSLLVAPYGVRRGIVRRIDDEIEAHRAGDPAARVRIKVNSIVDEQVIDALYRASQAGVPVDVVVRGTCAIRPGRPGLSENIHVRSILGRFLEHSRVFHFGSVDEYWIGSADMMHRNLDRRVEVLLRVADPRLATRLSDVLDSCLDPATRCWTLNADGSWRPSPAPGAGASVAVRDHQAEMMLAHAVSAAADAE